MGENGPYVFIGQLDMGDLLHDISAIYLFWDSVNGDVQYVIQSC